MNDSNPIRILNVYTLHLNVLFIFYGFSICFVFFFVYVVQNVNVSTYWEFWANLITIEDNCKYLETPPVMSAREFSLEYLKHRTQTLPRTKWLAEHYDQYCKLNSHSAVNLNRWNNLAFLFHFCSRWDKKRVGMLVRKVSLELSMWKSHRPIWSTTATMKLNIRPTNKYS